MRHAPPVALPVGLVLAVLGFALAACGEREEQRIYSVRGQVARVGDGGRELVVNHEAVPGWMAAMQMPFRVQDASATQGLAPGDKIRFDLYVAGSQALIGTIDELPDDTRLELAKPPGS